MSHWQHRARLLIAIGAVAFAVSLVFAFKRRSPPPIPPSVTRTDPEAVVESAKGRTLRLNRDREEVRVDYEKLLTYSDGSSKMLGVKVVTERGGGRTFTMAANEGMVAERESNVTLTGDVRVTVSDGLTLRTERATYTESDGMLRAPGPFRFARGRTNGSGVGLTYDKHRDVVTLAGQVRIEMAADEHGAGAAQIDAGTAEFDRPAKAIRLDRGLKVLRGVTAIEADRGLAHLSPDEERVELLELRGGSRVAPSQPSPGALQLLKGRDIDLKYGADGQTIERAHLSGDSSIQLAGERGQAGRQIVANTIDVELATDGSTPTSLVARDNVQLLLPGDAAAPTRTVTAQSMESRGQTGRGLTSARFEGKVQFLERGAGVDRAARSGALDLALAPGMSTIEEARFARAVRFEQDNLAASAPRARYLVSEGAVELSSDAGSPFPHVENERIAVDASSVDLTLTGPKVKAAGSVKSVLRPPDAKARGRGGKDDVRVPSMFKEDRPVNATADRLDYDGTAKQATYTGSAQLWQGDTTIKGSVLTLDEGDGDLKATDATTRTVLMQERREHGKAGPKERVTSIAAAKEFVYEEATRRVTYVGAARLSGPQGDMTSPRIELYLKPSGDELERVEAYEGITLREQSRRKTTGSRLTYFDADERYVVTGAPVTVVDECGRESTGRTLTFYKTTDRVVVDGNEQVRTQTRGAVSCP